MGLPASLHFAPSMFFLFRSQRRIISHIHYCSAQRPPMAPHCPWNKTRNSCPSLYFLHGWPLPNTIHFTSSFNPLHHGTSATLVICPSANLGDRLVWAPQRKFPEWAHRDTVRAVYWSTISPVKKNWKQMSITTAWQNNDSLFILWTISNRYFISFFRLFSPCGMHS